MKRKVLFISLFLVTFLVGSLGAWLMLRETPQMDCDLPKFDSANLEKIAPDLPLEKMSKPKTFKVQDIEEDATVNRPNKHFIELGEITNPEDFRIKSGEKWLGLFGENLRETKIKIRQTKRDKLDWTTISVKDKETPLFLVKNLKNVKAGKVTTLFQAVTFGEANENKQPIAIEKGFYREFKIGERKYRLRVEQGLSENREPIAVLLLETDTESQIIDFVWTDGEWVNMGNIYWVGDLDADGKLDLYKDFWNYEKGYYTTGLFLSSEAKKGEMVKIFVFFAFGGC